MRINVNHKYREYTVKMKEDAENWQTNQEVIKRSVFRREYTENERGCRKTDRPIEKAIEKEVSFAENEQMWFTLSVIIQGCQWWWKMMVSQRVALWRLDGIWCTTCLRLCYSIVQPSTKSLETKQQTFVSMSWMTLSGELGSNLLTHWRYVLRLLHMFWTFTHICSDTLVSSDLLSPYWSIYDCRYSRMWHCSFLAQRPTSRLWFLQWIISMRNSLTNPEILLSNSQSVYRSVSPRRLSTVTMTKWMTPRFIVLPWVSINMLHNYQLMDSP